MAVGISNVAARAATDAITQLVDGGSGAGTLIIYQGTRPANVDTAISSQTALVTFTLGNPAFAAAVDLNNSGHATANPVDPVPAVETGTAQFFRIFDGDGTPIIDGSVSDTSGSGDLKLSSTAIIEDITVTVVSITAAMPEA